jgi:uncharacterized membrane protein
MSAEAVPLHAPRLRLRLGAPAAFITGVLLLAGAVHISAILLVPAVAQNDGWSRLAAVAGAEGFAEIRVTGSRAANVIGLDPLFVNGACRLELAGAPAALAVEAGESFWSLALYDRQGTIVFSLNDRTALEGRLDMLVVTPAQSAELRHAPPPNIEQTVVVESQTDDLIALLRLFAPTANAQADAREMLAAAECIPAPLVATDEFSGG